MSKVNEAVVILAKCGDHHKAYGMRVERAERDQWLVIWAFPIRESAAKRENYDKTTVKGAIAFADEYPGCPYCGRKELTLCSCGRLNCTIVNSGVFTCEWCGVRGQIGAYTGEAITAGMDY